MKNVNELRDNLSEIFMQLKAGEIKPNDAAEMMYCAFWVQNFVNNHEAWAVLELGDGDRLITQATHWMPLPAPPSKS